MLCSVLRKIWLNYTYAELSSQVIWDRKPLYCFVLPARAVTWDPTHMLLFIPRPYPSPTSPVNREPLLLPVSSPGGSYSSSKGLKQAGSRCHSSLSWINSLALTTEWSQKTCVYTMESINCCINCETKSQQQQRMGWMSLTPQSCRLSLHTAITTNISRTENKQWWNLKLYFP